MDEQLVKYFTGQLNSKEHSELVKKVLSDDSLKRKFIEYQNITGISQLSHHLYDHEEGKSKLKVFKKKIHLKNRKVLFSNLLKYASVALILIVSTILGTLYLIDGKRGKLNSIYVPAGQRAQVTLEDGTEVWLNAQSTLIYPSKFSMKTREVEIIGEAFFDVAENKRKPFVVKTQNINMKVLGTEFNVYSYPSDKFVQTTLVEGLLEIFENKEKSSSIILQPNEQFTFENNTISVNHINNLEHLLWIKGIYSFNNEKLIDIIEKLEIYYDITIKVEDPEIFNVRYTGKFRQLDGVEEILRILQIIQPFNIERDRINNTIILTK